MTLEERLGVLSTKLNEALKSPVNSQQLATRLRAQAVEVAELYGDPEPPEGDMKSADKLWWTAHDAADVLEALVEQAKALSQHHAFALWQHCPVGATYFDDLVQICETCNMPSPCKPLSELFTFYKVPE